MFVAVFLAGLINDLGVEWEARDYLHSSQVDEFYGKLVLKNCEGGRRRGYESSIMLDSMEKEGCCIDNACYDRDELAEYIASSNGEARLPHNRRGSISTAPRAAGRTGSFRTSGASDANARLITQDDFDEKGALLTQRHAGAREKRPSRRQPDRVDAEKACLIIQILSKQRAAPQKACHAR